MAALFHFPTFLSLSSHQNSFFSSNPQQWPTHHYRKPTTRNFKICAFSIKRPRNGRKVKSNEELCNDIKEFVASAGLPDGHLPSLKELSQHGRSDLANIVRRRGYKLIKKLISGSLETDTDGFIVEENVVRKHDATTGDSDNCTKEATVHTLGDEKEMEGAMLEDVSASTLLPAEEIYSRSLIVKLDNDSDDISSVPEKSPAMLSLEEKVSKFVQHGDLDAIESDVYEILNESGDKERKEVVGTNDEVVTQSSNRSEGCSERAYDAVSRPYGSATVAKQVAPPVAMDYLPWSHDSKAQRLKSNDLREDLNSETTGRDNLTEINHLKSMLHQKELELSHLKKQIEKEKTALASLQNKAETEIEKAQNLVSEKDAELLAAEESLSGLQEVQLEYCGDGEIVEVAGSFNGWHHRIKMDPKPSPTIENPIESSKSKIWSTVLWLYPGIYEIKFVVDGQWKHDPERESRTDGRICNNILRVDR